MFKGSNEALLDLLAYPLFLFNEELFVAGIARKKSIPIFHTDAFVIRHLSGLTTGSILFKSKQIYQWFKDSTRNGPNLL